MHRQLFSAHYIQIWKLPLSYAKHLPLFNNQSLIYYHIINSVVINCSTVGFTFYSKLILLFNGWITWILCISFKMFVYTTFNKLCIQIYIHIYGNKLYDIKSLKWLTSISSFFSSYNKYLSNSWLSSCVYCPNLCCLSM